MQRIGHLAAAAAGRARPVVRNGSRLQLGYLYGGVVTYQAGEILCPRLLTDFELVLVIEGDVSYTSDGRTYAIPPGGMVFGRPGFHEAYRWDERGRTRHAYIHFGIDEIPADWPACEAWPRTHPQPDPVVAALFRHVLQHVWEHPRWPAMAPGPGDCRLVEALIDAFLEKQHTEAERIESERPEPVRRALKRMREIIDEDAQRSVSLADLARAAGVTEKHLCRLFARTLGHTPVRTYNLLRLQLGLALLSRSNLAVKEIALRCGYENAFHFSRVFGKAFGAAPTRVREALLRGQVPPNPLPTDLTPRIYW